MIKRIIKAINETLTHPKLLSSKPHTFEGENEVKGIYGREGDFKGQQILIRCFVTNDVIETTDTGAFKKWCYFSHEFDAFISEEGYRMIEAATDPNDENPNSDCDGVELLILKNELAFLKAEGGVRAPERKE